MITPKPKVLIPAGRYLVSEDRITLGANGVSIIWAGSLEDAETDYTMLTGPGITISWTSSSRTIEITSVWGNASISSMIYTNGVVFTLAIIADATNFRVYFNGILFATTASSLSSQTDYVSIGAATNTADMYSTLLVMHDGVLIEPGSLLYPYSTYWNISADNIWDYRMRDFQNFGANDIALQFDDGSTTGIFIEDDAYVCNSTTKTVITPYGGTLLAGAFSSSSSKNLGLNWLAFAHNLWWNPVNGPTTPPWQDMGILPADLVYQGQIDPGWLSIIQTASDTRLVLPVKFRSLPANIVDKPIGWSEEEKLIEVHVPVPDGEQRYISAGALGQQAPFHEADSLGVSYVFIFSFPAICIKGGPNYWGTEYYIELRLPIA
jgi:hypothetical protein